MASFPSPGKDSFFFKARGPPNNKDGGARKRKKEKERKRKRKKEKERKKPGWIAQLDKPMKEEEELPR